jgi:hypothetical protein
VKTIIHVNQFVIKNNKKTGQNNPAITVKNYKSNTYCNEVEINGPSRVIHSEKPLSCGARCWIECDSKDVVVLR